MPIKGVEQLDIERINSYEDNRFSEKALRQHGALVVNGIFFYEVLITGTSEAVITGKNRKYYEAVIEYFRFFAYHDIPGCTGKHGKRISKSGIV